MKAYPQRPKMFALHYVRWLIDSGAVNAAGPDAFALLVAVAMREDAIFYLRAPNYTTKQITREAGFGSEPALIRARKRAVRLGLLEYTPGAKRRPGTYFVSGFTNESLENREEYPNESLENASGMRQECVENASGKRHPPYPTPTLPDPTPKKERSRFVPPTVEQVQEYIKQAGISINAARFVGYHASKGWKVGSSPMKDWQAAVRYWWENEKQFKQVDPVTGPPKDHKPVVIPHGRRTDR